MGNPTKEVLPSPGKEKRPHRSCREAEDFACLSEEEKTSREEDPGHRGGEGQAGGVFQVMYMKQGQRREGHIYYVGIKRRRRRSRKTSIMAKDYPRGEAKGHHYEVTQGKASKKVLVPGYSSSKQTLRRPGGALSRGIPPN